MPMRPLETVTPALGDTFSSVTYLRLGFQLQSGVISDIAVLGGGGQTL